MEGLHPLWAPLGPPHTPSSCGMSIPLQPCVNSQVRIPSSTHARVQVRQYPFRVGWRAWTLTGPHWAGHTHGAHAGGTSHCGHVRTHRCKPHHLTLRLKGVVMKLGLSVGSPPSLGPTGQATHTELIRDEHPISAICEYRSPTPFPGAICLVRGRRNTRKAIHRQTSTSQGCCGGTNTGGSQGNLSS
jgi:hypothetical protein